jgi:hypothetical protein
MTADPADWEKITPRHLLPAVEYIRTTFETGHWKCSTITTKLGHAALHSQVSDLASHSPYQVAFEVYRQMISRTAETEFDSLLQLRTPPAVFRAYFDAYYEGLHVNVRDQFNQMLKVGLANSEALKIHPVEWAKSQLKFLVNGHVRSVERWIKEVCDTQEVPDPELIANEFEELVFWRKWRAPRLIHMQPAGNTSYEAATAWAREDEPRTRQLLYGRSRRFIEFLEIGLDKLAGDAHVRVAQTREYAQVQQQGGTAESPSIIQSSQTEQQNQVADRNRGTESRALMSKYRSALKRAILVQISQTPRATDLEICRGLDADGAVELPSTWRVRAGDRLFAGAYSNPSTRRKVEIAISKIRADLRNKGLLDRR